LSWLYISVLGFHRRSRIENLPRGPSKDNMSKLMPTQQRSDGSRLGFAKTSFRIFGHSRRNGVPEAIATVAGGTVTLINFSHSDLQKCLIIPRSSLVSHQMEENMMFLCTCIYR
jgi:hypothetical protein